MACALLVLHVSGVYAQQWHTTIDVRVPAAMQLQSSARRLLLVNNVCPQPDDFGHRLRRGDSEGSVTVDVSDAARYALFGMAAAMQDAEWLDDVEMLERTQNTSGHPFVKQQLRKAEVDSLYRFYDSDVILSLNQLLFSDVCESFLTVDNSYYASLTVICHSSWSVHYAGQSKIYTYSQADTLFWENERNTLSGALMALPERKQAILDVSEYVGKQVALLFVPHWQTVDRYMYDNGNEHLVRGMELFSHMHNDEAVDRFELAASTEGKSRKARFTRAYAEANIAVVREIQGDFDEAIRRAQKACDEFSQINSAAARQQYVNLSFYVEELKRIKSYQAKL